MSKYDPLEQFLRKQTTKLVPMSFTDIERIIGASLPPSARIHRPWWSNNPKNSVITKAWLRAGFRTERVNMEQGKLMFRRAADRSSSGTPQNEGADNSDKKRHPLFGALKGLIKIMPGTDLTQPADPDWGKVND